MKDWQSLAHTKWECKHHFVIGLVQDPVGSFTVLAVLVLGAAKHAFFSGSCLETEEFLNNSIVPTCMGR